MWNSALNAEGEWPTTGSERAFRFSKFHDSAQASYTKE